MNYLHKTMTAMSVMLALFLLDFSSTATIPIEQGSMAKIVSPEQQWQQQKGGGSISSSKDLYENMVLFEQEQGISDDDVDEDKGKGASLLSMMPDNSASVALIKCMSCAGVLPSWHADEDAHINEQLYCLPDGGSIQSNDNENNGNEDNVCLGSHCWKAKVRERDGHVRISRGCSVHGGGTPCAGGVGAVVGGGNGTTKNGNNSQQYTAWTISHTYSSAATDQQSQLYRWPASFAVDCCAGRNRCNDGLFPSLPLLPDSTTNGDSLLSGIVWWRWSPITWMAGMLLLVVFVVMIAAVLSYIKGGKGRKKRKRHKRNSGSRQRNKKRKQNARRFKEDNGADIKGRRHMSFSSMSSSSSSTLSLSSIGSSSSCCEGKPGRKRSNRRKRPNHALTMVDLLKGVVVTNDVSADNDDTHKGDQLSYTTEYSPAAMTESTVDGDFLTQPQLRRHDQHHKQQPEDDWTSGSGYGMPVLVQRTLAKQIQLRQLVGKGRYGEVWRATYWNGGHEHVAVKIFLSKDEPSWKRETEIYSTVLMRHDNILGFIGSDIMTSRNSYTTQLLLITHYHQHGSLYDFLQTSAVLDPACNVYPTSAIDTSGVEPAQSGRPPLTLTQMLNILYTVASGLCHLHTEIHGTQGKPGIAHRDIKSKNVLVKCALTGACCVADFGMAVTSRDVTIPIQTTTAAGVGNSQNTRVGTKRYMAPEVLDDSITSAAALALASASTSATTSASAAAATSASSAYWCFDAYRRGDVYSYALIMWEVLSRTIVSSKDGPPKQHKYNEQQQQHQPININEYNPYVYRAPYQDRGAGWDPGFDDMRNIVCSADPILSRPGIATEWLDNSIMNAVVSTMRECWHGNPNARLPSLRVKKTLAKLMDQCANVELKQQCESELDQLTKT